MSKHLQLVEVLEGFAKVDDSTPHLDNTVIAAYRELDKVAGSSALS